MKKTLSIALVLALVLALSVPALAFAGKGGVKGPSNGSRAAERASAASADDGQAPVNGKKSPKAPKKGAHEAPDEAPDTDVADASSETSVPMSPGKRKGITNALSRITATLERMQADLDAGLRKQLPPGLVRVMEKFMGWLGESADGDLEPGVLDGTGPDESIDTGSSGQTEELPDSDGEPLALPDPLPFV